MKKLSIYLVLSFIFGCSTGPYSPPEREYLNDRVSVKIVLQQAHAAYVRGCLIAHKEYKKQGVIKYCKNLADKYVETDILKIMDQ